MGFLELAKEILPDLLLVGTKATLQYTFISITIGIIFGFPLALGKIYGRGPIKWLCSAFVGLVRGTPLVTQLFIIYFGLPSVGVTLPPFLSAIIGLGLNSAAYQAEYFRGAMQAVSPGQVTAGRAIGMTKFQSILYIVIPQTVRLVIPSWSNELIYLVKYSSLVYLIQAPELMFQAKVFAVRSYRYFEIYLIVAAIYLVIVLILAWILRKIENKISVPGLGIMRKASL